MDHSIRSHRGISPRLGQRVYVDPAATVIGDVNLGDDASVWPGAVIRGDMHSIKIGARSNVQDNAVLHITHASDFNPDGWPLTIGDDVVIGHRAVLHGCSVGNQNSIANAATMQSRAVTNNHIIAHGHTPAIGVELRGMGTMQHSLVLHIRSGTYLYGVPIPADDRAGTDRGRTSGT